MKIANCPHCGGPCSMKYGMLNGTNFQLDGWQCMCERCGYSGPVGETQDEAVRAHNKISQNCGAT